MNRNIPSPSAFTYMAATLVAATWMLIAPVLVFAQTASGDDAVLDAVTSKKDLYVAGADAKKEVQAALSRAKSERKRVLLIFGANWCYDCHVLDRALHEGEAGAIVKERFILVHVDIGEGNKNLDLTKTYKTPLDKGVPALAILDSEGRLLYSSSDGEFESARRMIKRDLIAFLDRWR